MSQPLTPSPTFDVPPILPDPAVATPPYTSDEGSVAGDLQPYPHIKAHPNLVTNTVMSANRVFESYQTPDTSNPSSSSASMRNSHSGSMSQSPSLPYSYSNPNIFATYPQSYPTTSYFPHQQPAVPISTAFSASPPWQTTDTERNASGLDVDLEVDYEGMTDDGTARSSHLTASPMRSESSSKDPIPRPPNAWILYRSDMLKDLASGNDIPGLDAVLTKLGYGPSTSASSDESHNEASSVAQSSSTKGKSKGKTDSEMMPPPSTKTGKKSKKVKKEPTEQFLSLGTGKTGKGLPQAHISKLISTLWKNETEERKAFYERKADIRKIEHQRKYPEYKFQPMRKADKLRQREEREREKEELKRQKEAEKQAGKAKRHQRRRNRLSPASPYALMNQGKRPETGSISRSLSYSGESLQPASQWWSTGSAGRPTTSYAGPRRETEPSPRYGLGAEPLGMYPFPFPTGALPALGPEDIAAQQQTQQGTPGAMIAQDYHQWQESLAQPQDRLTPVAPAPHVYIEPTLEVVPSAPAMSQQSSTSNSSEIYSALSESSISEPPDIVPTQLPVEGLGVYPTMHSAVPFIADPLPMDIQGRPMPILGFEDIQPLPDDDNGDPAALAELWWNLQDEDVQDDTANSTIPSGLLADDRMYQGYEVDAAKGVRQSGTRGMLIISSIQEGKADGTDLVSIASADPSSGTNSGAPPTPSSTFIAQDPFSFPMDAQQPYPYPQGYVPMFVSVIPEDGNVDPSIPFFTPGYDANLPYLPMEAAIDPALYASTFDEQGPFLSAQQPMSPTESWSAGPTPREATFLRAAQAQNEQNRIASSSSEGTVRAVSSNQAVPRYVSASAYPLTPLSQDPSALPGSGGIVDRNTSYTALAAVMSGQAMGTSMGMGPDDLLAWDDNDVIEHEEEEEIPPQQARKISQAHLMPTLNTPVTTTSSATPFPAQHQPRCEPPAQQQQQQVHQKDPIIEAPVPRRVNTRSRAVAAKFAGVEAE
uniref:HMG box domain-containing protein n=1 Tax=Kwoniella dejecticola CBS 10117 TaxID=1296121 RepID=A0A1A6AHK2_9TREE|nr:uncharacterized protein I303_01321 [Kwoniella dejecticola CBS 10117]OBR89493.1 hypothetical protein I303_01321 [Kwoniella dejecticola CBS 10117]